MYRGGVEPHVSGTLRPRNTAMTSHGGEAEKEKSLGALGSRGGKDAYDWARKESGSEEPKGALPMR